MAFFTVRGGKLTAWRSRGVAKANNDAVLGLDESSTFKDIVAAGMPYNGPFTDSSSRTFLTSALGDAPDEAIALPVLVRGRPVGLIYGDKPRGEIQKDHISVIGHAAGDAFERMLMAAKAKL